MAFLIPDFSRPFKAALENAARSERPVQLSRRSPSKASDETPVKDGRVIARPAPARVVRVRDEERRERTRRSTLTPAGLPSPYLAKRAFTVVIPSLNTYSWKKVRT